MSEPRRLRSKRLRAALYTAAGGACQRCGDPLGPGWHADHIDPWINTRRTNVHEMQALCAKCNLQKGASTVNLRKHQEEGKKIARALADKALATKIVVAMVTPGGGKSLLASIVAHILLNAKIVDRVCWVCPRTSLVTQAEDGFCVPSLALEYLIRAADNTTPLVRDIDRGCRGYVTTYQAVAANPELHRDEFRAHRYLLILDEPHHLCDDEKKSWLLAIRPMVEKAVHVLQMSGTMERHDRARIPFITYDSDNKPTADINYTRRDALDEEAVLPIAFQFHDGWVKYLDGFAERRVDISTCSLDDASKVIRTFLGQTSYRDQLLRRGLDHWVTYTVNVYKSRCIVICDGATMARAVAKMIHDDYHVQVALALSEDGDDAQRTIRQFRRGERGDVLVTVGMAYEGLDVPDCTHLVCLTSIRSVPWLEQAFARVTRVDRKCGIEYALQQAYIFVPDDPLMRDVVARMRSEQIMGLRDDVAVGAPQEPRQPRQEGMHVGLEAHLDGVKHEDWNGRLPDHDSAIVEIARKRLPGIAHVPPRAVIEFAREVSALIGVAAPANAPPREVRTSSLSEQENGKRRAIQSLALSLDKANGWEFGTTNKMIIRRFNRSREAMGLTELDQVIAWLRSGAAA